MHEKTLAGLAILAAAALLLGSASCAAGDGPGGEIGAVVDAAIRPLMQEHAIPGMAVAITLKGQRHYFNYGVAKQSGPAVTEDTIFEIGSISKTFTATLAAYAQESGALSLADNASHYLPALRGSCFDHISLLELGTYTAGGLPLQFPEQVTDRHTMLGYYQHWQPTHAAGTYRRYSNPSLGLLGLLAAESMGESFEDLLEKRLFPQLGLRQSYLQVPAERMNQYAYGYTQAGQPVRVSPGVLDAEAYGVKSSAADMLHFVEANLPTADLEEPLRRAIAATHTGYYRVGDMTQGLGWELYPYPVALERLLAGNSPAMALEAHAITRLEPPLAPQGNVLINKTGSTNGFGAYVAFVPAKGIGIVLLANTNYPNAARVQVAHALLTALDARLGAGTGR